MLKKIFIFLLLTSPYLLAFSQNDGVLGYWKTIDDKTNKPKAIVAIYQNNDTVYGRIIAIFDKDTGKIKESIYSEKLSKRVKSDPSKPYVVGLDILKDLKLKEKKDEWWDKGSILDPEEDKTYDCDIWRDGKNLFVRGWLSIFRKTQTWVPLKSSDIPKDFKLPNYKKITFGKPIDVKIEDKE